jgi:hypothetical protein
MGRDELHRQVPRRRHVCYQLPSFRVCIRGAAIVLSLPPFFAYWYIACSYEEAAVADELVAYAEVWATSTANPTK